MSDIYVIDVEATSLNQATADIMQLTALKYSSNIKEWELKNWYYTQKKPIPFESKNITGLTEEYLKEQSNGLLFEELCDEALDIFNPDNLLVGHNIIGYDSAVIKNNFSKVGIKLRSFPKMYDTMREAKTLSYVSSGRFIKLGDLFNMSCEHFGLSPKKLMDMACETFKLNEYEIKAHNAKYDVLLNGFTYYLMCKNLGVEGYAKPV